MDSHALDSIRQRLVDSLSRQNPTLLQRYPIQEYIGDLRSLDPFAGYRYLPDRVVVRCNRILEDEGLEVFEQYHRLLLITLIGSFESRLSKLAVPPDIVTWTIEFAHRILNDIENPRSSYFRHENDRFAKDLGVCRLKLLVCGPEVIDLHSGFPRRYLAAQPRAKLVSRATFFARETRGFRPFFETHMDRRLIRLFSPDGYASCYHSLAKLLIMNPEVKGVIFGATWFVDPVLDSISPELSYLRTVPTENGARLFPAPTTERAIRDAVRLSPVRQRLYEKKKYVPQSYVIVWPRRRLIEWSRGNASDA